MIRNKRGQFFLIGAIIIIAVVASVITITNYTQKQDVTRLYDLGEELGIESQHVLDYGTYSELNETELNNLMERFIVNYVEYIKEDKNIYFIFGNKNKINVVGYQDILAEDVIVCLDVGEHLQEEGVIEKAQCVPYQTIGETQAFSKEDKGDIQKVTIQIGGDEYQFRLKYGENFYFVIWQEIGGEKHVVTSPTE